MGVFQDQILRFMPGYMLGRNMRILAESFGATIDAMAQRFEDGRIAASVGDCDPEVLPYHALDRGIRLYATEPVASRRQRLAMWRQLRHRKGTHRGELEHLQPYFLPGVLPTLRIVHTSGTGKTFWHTRDVAGTYSIKRSATTWDWDGALSHWSRFWLILECSTPFGITARGTLHARGDRPGRRRPVLNAFRHHGQGNIRRVTRLYCSSLCSTPFGITARGTIRDGFG